LTHSLKKDIPEIDRNVKELLDKGLAKEEIQSRLSLKASTLLNSLKRIRSSNEIPPPPTLRKKELAERRQKIRELKRQGLQKEDIQKILQIGKGALEHDIEYLQKKGELPRERRVRMTREELNELDSQVRLLREADLFITNTELASQLNVSAQDINASVIRLRKTMEIATDGRQSKRMQLRRQTISELFQERRYSLQELSQRFSVTESTVRIDLKALGLEHVIPERKSKSKKK
jgi:transposase